MTPLVKSLESVIYCSSSQTFITTNIYRFLIVNVAIGKLTNSWAKSWGGGPTVNLIITSSLSIEYKEKQPFTVFQTALQNMLILSFLYQCDRIIPQHRINRKQNSFSFPVTHYLFLCVCVCVVHGLGP